MANKNYKSGNKKIVGGNIYKASNGAMMATDNSRFASTGARQVTDNAMASFGRSVGPYGAGATEYSQLTMYQPVDPYAGDDGVYYEDPYYSDGAFYAGEPFANEDPYYDPFSDPAPFYDYNPYQMFDQLGDLGEDSTAASIATYVSPWDAAAKAPIATVPGQDGSGFFDSLGGAVSGLVGGVGNLLTGLVSGIGKGVNQVGKSLNSTSGSSSLDTSKLQAAIDKLAGKTQKAASDVSTKSEKGGSLDKLLPIAALGIGAVLLMKAMKK